MRTFPRLFMFLACIPITFSSSANPHANLAEGVLFGEADALDPQQPPGHNFDLLDWHLTLPVDTNSDRRADRIGEAHLANGFELKPVFFTSADGGMTFVAPNRGARTSENTQYVRTELREMLRRGNTRIPLQGVNKNNWVFSNMHYSGQKQAGAVDGSLEATLAVNRVSTSGEDNKVGRVIVGQIHATDDEPIRLYYRKLPKHEKGSVYFAHEPNGGDDIWVNLVGSRADDACEPDDGIALHERFSYKITVVKDQLYVTLIRQGRPNVTQVVDMIQSGYHLSNQYMYFKAGVYNQNNSGDQHDYAQATFYHLANSHRGYRY